MRAIALLILAILVTGCGVFRAGPLPVFRALVRVQGDPGQAIAGARLAFKNKAVGTTDTSGLVELALRGRDGQVFDLTVACPNGYRSPTKPLAVTVRKMMESQSLPEYHVQCAPLLRTVVVAVRAVNGPNLPVVFLGRERTRTDASGAAHLVLQVPPNQSLQVQLDTSGAKDLSPKSPTATLEVTDEDKVMVLEQRFEVERRVVVRRASRSRGPTPL
jgi:hypothetical protein